MRHHSRDRLCMNDIETAIEHNCTIIIMFISVIYPNFMLYIYTHYIIALQK